jgi:hypothetical protein
MQACIENTDLPLVKLTSPQLPDRVPTWTIRVARPISTRSHELAQELRGVPKGALRHVFGKAFGTRLWRQNRAAAIPATAKTPTSATAAPVAATLDPVLVPDAEVSGGMLRYLCAEAAATLRERQRVAKSISLTLQYPNGESETAHQLLLRSTNDAGSLEAAAQAAIRGMRSDAFLSLKLDLTATQP